MNSNRVKKCKAVSARLVFVVISLLILLFQNILDARFSLTLFGYYDELLAFIGILYLLRYSVSHRFNSAMGRMLVFLFIVLFFGTIGTLLSDVSSWSVLTLLDAFSFLKIYVIYAAAVIYLNDFAEHACVVRIVANLCLVFVLIGLFFGVLNLIMDIGMHTDIRYGFRAFNFVFSRVGNLYEFCSLVIVIFFLDGYLNKRKFASAVGIICSVVLMALTLRTRAFAFAAVFFFLYCFQYKIGRGKLNVATLLILSCLVIFVGFDQFYNYFLDDDASARKSLLQYGLITCRDYFPLGSGFATYGTNWANLVSTPLYSQYGFDLIYGLGYIKSTYATDNSWPAAIGELGVFGFLFFAAAVYCCLSDAWKRCKSSRTTRFLSTYLIICFLVGTTATASIFTSVCLMVELAFLATLCGSQSTNQHSLDENVEVV